MEQPLHIAILSLHSCPYIVPGGRYTGGMNIYIRNLARELSNRGHSVDIYTCSQANCSQCGKGDLGKNIRLIHVDNIDYNLITETTLENNIERITRSILIGAPRYDLIYSHYWFSGLVGTRLKSVWQVPHFTMFHTLGLLKNSAGLGELEPPYRVAGEMSVAQSADHIIASTAGEKKELASRYKVNASKISVIPCGINNELFRPVDKQYARVTTGLGTKRTILFVGRHDPLKCLDNLLEATSLLNHRDDFQLVVIGDNSQHLDQIQTELGDQQRTIGNGNIVFIGSVPHENMYLYYNAADFCIIPSYYESFNLVAIESIACGTPVLATAVGEIPSLAGMCDLCRIMEDNSPANLARHMDAMLDSIGQNTGGCTGNMVLKYSWRSITDRLEREFSKATALQYCHKEAVLHR
ncbi:MAG: glycosyltransferase [Chloroflexi bacterium]|nr:glycosyltransferase [Chloroflexota bacterium]